MQRTTFEQTYSMDTPETIAMLQREVCDYIVNHINYRSCLDIGCGDGGMNQYLPGWHGVDLHPQAENIHQGTIYTVDARYDLIIYNHVLEHIEHCYEEVRTAARKCNTIFVAVPSVEATNKDWLYGVEEHLHIFSQETLVRLLRRCGFREVTIVIKELQKGREEIWAIGRK